MWFLNTNSVAELSNLTRGDVEQRIQNDKKRKQASSYTVRSTTICRLFKYHVKKWRKLLLLLFCGVFFKIRSVSGLFWGRVYFQIQSKMVIYMYLLLQCLESMKHKHTLWESYGPSSVLFNIAARLRSVLKFKLVV